MCFWIYSVPNVWAARWLSARIEEAMVVVRLARGGCKKRPFYRIVVADQRRSRDGRYIEQIGYYDPRADSQPTMVKFDRIDHWLSQGAQLSERVSKIVKTARQAQPEVAV